MTCDEATTDTPTVYEWYKGNDVIGGAASKTYELPDNKRANSGNYFCKVTTTNRPISEKSDAKSVLFLCKSWMPWIDKRLFLHLENLVINSKVGVVSKELCNFSV